MTNKTNLNISLAVSLLSLITAAQAIGDTYTYVFIPDQSIVVVSGGIAGIYEIYTIEGQFQLTVNFDANTASFDVVDANLSYGVDLDDLFDMTELVGTVVSDTEIDFDTADPMPGGKVVHLDLTLTNNSVHLTGGFCQLWPDGFCFDMNAVAQKITSVYYVDADAPGAGDGSSWDDAFIYLQHALSEAQSYGLPAEIRVAQGTYKPNEGVLAIPEIDWRTVTFQLINGVTIKGGYAGLGAPDPNARDIDLYKTILSGDLNGDDSQASDPCDLLDDPNRIDNSYHVLMGSSTDETAVLDGFTITGGHYYVNCLFPPCGGGGGMFNPDGSPTLISCTFTKNVGNEGGGIYNSGNSSPTVANCTFSGNFAISGGGMYGGNGSITNCTFTKNLAYGGGALGGYNGLISNCTFSGNSAEGYGGAMFIDSYNPTLTNCLFSGNSADGDGGGIFCGLDSTIINCTISGNSAGFKGGGIFCADTCVLEMTNSIVWNNTAEYGQQIYSFGGSRAITYCDVQGDCPGQGNIDTDPNFVDPDGPDNDPNTWQDNDYHLQWNSPCINAGDPCYVVGQNERDIDGEPRVMAGRIDMGVDEVGEKQADFTRDGIINFKDFAILGRCWWSCPTEANWYVLCDLYKDEHIDILDLAEYANDWLWQASWYGDTPEPEMVWYVDPNCAAGSVQEQGQSTTLQEPEELRFTVTVEGSYIHFEDMIHANCCPGRLWLEMTVEDYQITIYEFEEMPGCFCMCDFPTTATLGPFAEGDYLLEVIDVYGNSLGSVSVTIPGPE